MMVMLRSLTRIWKNFFGHSNGGRFNTNAAITQGPLLRPAGNLDKYQCTASLPKPQPEKSVTIEIETRLIIAEQIYATSQNMNTIVSIRMIQSSISSLQVRPKSK